MNRLNSVRLTRRGRVVVALLIALTIAGVYYIATHVWWVGDSYCLGTLADCLLREQASVEGANS
jgi:hypothetical protein